MKNSLRILDVRNKKYLGQNLIGSQTKNLKIENETVNCPELKILRLQFSFPVFLDMTQWKTVITFNEKKMCPLLFSSICHCISTYGKGHVRSEKRCGSSGKAHLKSRLPALLPLYNYVLSLPFFGLLLKIIPTYSLTLHSWAMNSSKSTFLYKPFLASEHQKVWGKNKKKNASIFRKLSGVNFLLAISF